jgi:hypothetical protein
MAAEEGREAGGSFLLPRILSYVSDYILYSFQLACRNHPIPRAIHVRDMNPEAESTVLRNTCVVVRLRDFTVSHSRRTESELVINFSDGQTCRIPQRR